jgi:hypothetical protein
MTPGGHCFQCRSLTSRYDTEHRRWACRACSPKNLGWEDALAVAAMQGRQIDSSAPWDDRPAGMTRQEWRRRMRTGAESALQQPQVVGAGKGQFRAMRHSSDPWRQRGARGTWGGA